MGAISPNPALFARVGYGTLVRPQVQAFDLTVGFLRSSEGHQFLSQTSELSGASSYISVLAGAGNPLILPEAIAAALVFKGISLAAKTLNIGFHSDDPIRDTLREVIKLFVGKQAGPIRSPFINKGLDWYDDYLRSRERS